jgi:hypothetical protein
MDSEDRQSQVALPQEVIPVLERCRKRNWKTMATGDGSSFYSSYYYPEKGLMIRSTIILA